MGKQADQLVWEKALDSDELPEGRVKPVTCHRVTLCMTRYRDDFDQPVLFPRARPADVFGQELARLGIANLRVAETEKYAHVTYFFNGGEETPFPGEERILLPSPKVATYDLAPEMSAADVGAAGADGVRSGRFGALILNFAKSEQ